MTSRILAFGTALSLALTAQVASAQDPSRSRVPSRFREMDRNNDGIISRSEWTGTAVSFQTHDWNHDNMLSGDELRLGARPGAQSADPEFDSAYREYPLHDWTVRGFTALDHNRDNRITRDEWHFDRESFRRADHDGNGVISRAEFLDEDAVDDDLGDRFADLDADNDGRISRSEWHGALLLFNSLDTNHDAALTRAEMSGIEPPSDLFASVDVNGDGTIAPTEWHWARSSFDRRDANNDGRLTAEEFRGVVTPNLQTAAYRAGAERGELEGRAAGREDRVRNGYWDLDGQRELEQADSGYNSQLGPKAEYQAGYRESFRRAYREGWNSAATQ